MKDLGKKFMSDPLSKIELSEGILMLNTKGETIRDSSPIKRDPSKQLTIHEYASLKNNEQGLKSQVSEILLNKSQSKAMKDASANAAIAERDLISRLKPDSAQ